MRLDIFLKRAGLVRQRAHAKEACDEGAVTISGQRVKPGRAVAPGQKIRIAFPRRILEVEVLALPEGSVSRSERRDCYRVLEDTARGWDQ
jgi:ribosomal 50S subunit-recycling heat shock protein